MKIITIAAIWKYEFENHKTTQEKMIIKAKFPKMPQSWGGGIERILESPPPQEEVELLLKHGQLLGRLSMSFSVKWQQSNINVYSMDIALFQN